MSFEVDYFDLDATDSSRRFVILSGTPVSIHNVALDIIGGTSQMWTDNTTGDFGVDGTRIRWDSTSYGLYSDMTTGDKIRVIYDRT
jgi:hypothetical protein